MANLDQKPGEAPKTVRARLELHRDNPTCKMCHGVIDPTGLALENFDAIGHFRQTDAQANNAAIDASTVMPSGKKINGPVELREELASHPEFFVETITESLLTYAVNRRLRVFLTYAAGSTVKDRSRRRRRMTTTRSRRWCWEL